MQLLVGVYLLVITVDTSYFIQYIVSLRGANPQAADIEGKTPAQLIEESALDDVDIIGLSKSSSR